MENNGRGIFYGVIGVATLVVAIIGATFAYFSANATSETFTAGSANVSLNLTQVASVLNADLIPVNEVGFAGSTLIGTTSGMCKDINKNSFCSATTFTIKNPSTTVAQQVYATLEVASNTFPVDATNSGAGNSNLRYAIFKGAASDIGTGWGVSSAVTTDYAIEGDTGNAIPDTYHIIGKNGDLVVAGTAVPTGTSLSLDLGALDQVIPTNSSVTYTVLVWLHETGAQQNTDQSKAFSGAVKFTTEDGSGLGVTAVLSADSGSDEDPS